jgi:FlaA1/EpsC-like NDP-sugar epimerase
MSTGNGRVTLVTGGTGGIGSEICKTVNSNISAKGGQHMHG